MLRQDLDCMDWILTHGSRPKCPSWSASLEPHTLEKTKGQKDKKTRREKDKKKRREKDKRAKAQTDKKTKMQKYKKTVRPKCPSWSASLKPHTLIFQCNI